MTLVAGVDSSTQSVKIVVCDLETGSVVRTARASHPDARKCRHPPGWRPTGKPQPIPPSSMGFLRWPSVASSTAWSPLMRMASSSAMPCCGTTTGPPRTPKT